MTRTDYHLEIPVIQRCGKQADNEAQWRGLAKCRQASAAVIPVFFRRLEL